VPAKAKSKSKVETRASKPRKAARKAPPSKAPRAKAASPRPILGRPDWRVETIAQVRALIEQADPEAVEEVKWRKPSNGMQGVPTWSHHGLLCTGETYKDKVKLTFARGASLEDPAGLFNADDRGSTRRAIDLREGDTVDAEAFTALVRAAVEANGAGKKRPAAT
jgi:hypothetical protein